MSRTPMDRRNFLGSSLLAGGTWMTGGLGPLSRRDVDRDALDWRVRQNETIQAARRVALDVLKPSRSQLEHGLALHRDSLVFDAYGFSPYAAVDGQSLRAAIEAGASDIEVKDLTEEMRMTRAAVDEAERAEYMAAWHASGVTCVFQNAGEEGQDPERLVKRLARYTYVTDLMRDFVFKAARPEDVERAKQEGRHCLYFTGNGVPLTQEWVSVQDELRYVPVFMQLGVRMMHLTYNRRNMIGDGCAEPTNAGLSIFGGEVVQEMNRRGLIVDVAHSGWQTGLDAARISTRPIVASHSGADAVNHHIRCKPDEVIRAIADTGGYIGICCIPRFLGGAGDVSAMLDHIDYVAKRFGTEHVAIGTDKAYQSPNTEAEVAKIPRRPKSRESWEALWPPEPFVTTGRMMQSMLWTNWPLFTVGLVQRGYRDEDIRKIIGGNVMRVTRAVLQ